MKAQAASPDREVTVDEVRAIADAFVAEFRGHLPLEVVVARRQEDIFGEQATRERVGRIVGAFYPTRRKIALAALSMRDRAEVVATLKHETLGHFGTLCLGEEAKRDLLEKLIAVRHLPDGMGFLWREVERHWPEPKRALRDDERRAFVEMQAEEVFAVAAEKTDTSALGQAWIEIKATAVRGLRKMGFVRDAITVPEVEALVVSLARGIRAGRLHQQIFPEADFAQFSRRQEPEAVLLRPALSVGVRVVFAVTSDAFRDVGMQAELQQVLRQAAERLTEGWPGELRDTNGQVVGRVERATARATRPGAGSVEILLVVSPGREAEVGEALRGLAGPLARGDAVAPVLASTGAQIGRVTSRIGEHARDAQPTPSPATLEP